MKRPEGISYTEDGDTWHVLPKDTTVSMNFWGFTGSMMKELEKGLEEFFETSFKDDPGEKRILSSGSGGQAG